MAAALAVSFPAVYACTWSYPIWAIRSQTADPLFRFMRNKKAGYIDATGKIVLQPVIAPLGNFGGEFHEGLLALRDGRYVDSSGTTRIRWSGGSAGGFSEGLAPVGRGEYPAQWGFMDPSGRLVIPAQYFRVDDFSDGLAGVSVSGDVGSRGYVDHEGNFVIPPTLTYGFSFHEGLVAAIVEGPCRMTNIGSCGPAAFEPVGKRAQYECRYSFIDRTGKPISELRFDYAQDFSEGLAAVRMGIGKQWGFVDKTGKLAIQPQFTYAHSFSEGLAAVTNEYGKVGFIDRSGNFVIEPQSFSAEGFSNGRALITEGGFLETPSFRYIDKTGKPAFPGTFQRATSFRHGLAHVTWSVGHAWIDTSGRPVFKYSE